MQVTHEILLCSIINYSNKFNRYEKRPGRHPLYEICLPGPKSCRTVF